jgi:hypothetical protein
MIIEGQNNETAKDSYSEKSDPFSMVKHRQQPCFLLENPEAI